MGLHLDEGVEALPGYRIVRKLGQGGFGEVWEAEAPGGVHIALKFIRLGTSASAPELRALEIIRNVRHPHLLDIQFTVQRDEFLIVATPLCDESLWDRLCYHRSQGRKGLPPEELLENMEEVAKAVDFLNDARHPGPGGTRIGIQHRDIKPHNIFLVGGCARLADFGLAKVLEKNQCSHTGSMTPSYMAPEVLRGIVTPFSDQYSLAVTYCQLRCGELPFQGDVGRVMYGHIHDPPDLSALPPDERSIVSRAMSKSPDERWPSCQAFVRQLRETPLVDLGELTRDPGGTYRPDVAITADVTTEKSTGARRLDVPTLPASSKAPVPASHSDVSRSRHRHHARRRLRFVGLGVVGITLSLLVLIGSGRSSLRVPEGLLRFFTRSESVGLEGLTGRAVSDASPTPPKGTQEIEPTKPRSLIVRIHPPTAKVAVDGEPVRQDRAGRIELPWSEDSSHEVVAQQEGYREFRRRVPRDEMAKAPFHVRLEPEVTPPPARNRPFLGKRDVLGSIKADLAKTPTASRRFQRYFSLTNLHNNLAATTDGELRAARTALANVVESLSRAPNVVVPAAVDEGETIFKVDVRGLVREEFWQEILRVYPYGVKHDHDDDLIIRELAREVYEESGTEQPYIRADWFVWYIATAAPPPLRDAFLGHAERERDPEQEPREDERVRIRGIPDPVNVLVRHYARSLGASEVAGELGIADVEALVTRIQNDPKLQILGLKALGARGHIRRDEWRDVFAQVINHLNLGIPYQAL